MKKIIMLALSILLLVSFALAFAATITTNSPADLFETTTSDVVFNFTIVGTNASYWTIVQTYNGTAWIDNISDSCTNNTACTMTSTFTTGFHQWRANISENSTSMEQTDSRWLQVRTVEESRFINWTASDGTVAMTLNTSNGFLDVKGELAIGTPPAACSVNTYMTKFTGNSSTCTAVSIVSDLTANGTFAVENTTGTETFSVTEGGIVTVNDVLTITAVSAAPEACVAGLEGSIYADSDLFMPCYCNSTTWIQFDDFATTCS